MKNLLRTKMKTMKICFPTRLCMMTNKISLKSRPNPSKGSSSRKKKTKVNLTMKTLRMKKRRRMKMSNLRHLIADIEAGLVRFLRLRKGSKHWSQSSDNRETTSVKFKAYRTRSPECRA